MVEAEEARLYWKTARSKTRKRRSRMNSERMIVPSIRIIVSGARRLRLSSSATTVVLSVRHFVNLAHRLYINVARFRNIR